jgi:hypothetical protein
VRHVGNAITITAQNYTMRKDFKTQLRIPLLLTVVFVVSSFAPVMQILILTYDGALIWAFYKVVGADDTGDILAANIAVNLLPTAVLLLAFCKATKQHVKIVTATLSMIFMTAFTFFLTNGKDSNPYFLKFIVIELISGSILILVAILKYYLNQRHDTTPFDF